MNDFTADGKSVSFWLRVKPRSRRRRLFRTASGELCLELTAPPVEGKANEDAIDFLSRSLRVPRSSVELATGARSRRKLFRIATDSTKEVMSQLSLLVEEKN